MIAAAGVEALSRTLLYEGYALYPYTRDALKNRKRFSFGEVFPERAAAALGARSTLQTECLLAECAAPRIEASLRYLELARTGHDDIERTLELACSTSDETCTVASPWHSPAAHCELSLCVQPLERAGVFRITVRVVNRTPCAPDADRDSALSRALLGAHILLHAADGRFISRCDPPARYRRDTEDCESQGLWPALVGTPGTDDWMLAAPIILPDYPRIAPESPGDHYDSTEIDEMLVLRLQTLSERERDALRGDLRTRELLERAETVGERGAARLHGRTEHLPSGLAPGARVRLRPGKIRDALDRAMAGRAATIAAIERDLEGRVYVAVHVEDDPGRDLDVYAHRFFFSPDELEPIPEPEGRP